MLTVVMVQMETSGESGSDEQLAILGRLKSYVSPSFEWVMKDRRNKLGNTVFSIGQQKWMWCHSRNRLIC